MINLKCCEDDDKKEMETMIAKSEYPYGLRINLDHDTMEKLGLKELPPIGAKVNLEAIAEVVSVSSHKCDDGEMENSVCLQITDMELKKQSISKKIYGE